MYFRVRKWDTSAYLGQIQPSTGQIAWWHNIICFQIDHNQTLLLQMQKPGEETKPNQTRNNTTLTHHVNEAITAWECVGYTTVLAIMIFSLVFFLLLLFRRLVFSVESKAELLRWLVWFFWNVAKWRLRHVHALVRWLF